MTYLYLVLTTFFWAAVFHLGKYAITYMSPLSAAAWRFLLAGALLIPVVYLQKGWDSKSVHRNLWPLLAMGVIGVFGFNSALFFGLKLTSPMNGALIMAFNPVITALLTAILLNDKIQSRQWMGFAVSLIGVIVIVCQGSLANLLAMKFSTGDLLIFLGCICWAMYSVIPKRFIENMSTMMITTTTILIGAGALAVMAQFTTGDLLVTPPWPVALSVIAMSVFGSVLAYIWWNQGVARLGAARVAIFINLVPVFATAIGIAFGQSVSKAQLIGGALVIVGVTTTVFTRQIVLKRTTLPTAPTSKTRECLQ